MDRAQRRFLAANKKTLILREFQRELDKNSKRIAIPGWKWSGPRYNTDEEISVFRRRYMRDEGRFWRSYGYRKWGCTCWYCTGYRMMAEQREKDRTQDEIIDYLISEEKEV